MIPVKEEIDLRQRINRETFEEMTAGFFSHVTGPVRMALETWGGTMDEIAEVRSDVNQYIVDTHSQRPLYIAKIAIISPFFKLKVM